MRGLLFALAATVGLSGAAHPQASDPANLPMKPGDRLLVKVWLDTVFADTVRIDQAGAAVLPRFGPIPLSGLGANFVADSVRRTYATMFRTPSIEITPLRRIVVIGEVNKPGTYYLDTHATYREALAIAGGVDAIGQPGHLVVLRDSVQTRFDDWQKRGDALAVIHSGDVVWIDREPWIKQNIFPVISGFGTLFAVFYSVFHK